MGRSNFRIPSNRPKSHEQVQTSSEKAIVQMEQRCAVRVYVIPVHEDLEWAVGTVYSAEFVE